MKLAIVVGHNSVSQGAVRKDTGETEFVWNSRLAKMIARQGEDHGLDVKVFHRTSGGGYSTELRRVYGETDRWGADATVELHFNGASSAAATGTETLSSGTALSLKLAASVQREMVAALGLRDRGVKTRAAKDRGGKSLFSGQAPAILIEPFFGSSAKGTAATDTAQEQERLALAILEGAADALSTFPRSTLADSRTMAAAAQQRTAQAVQGNAGIAATLATVAMTARGEIEQLPAVGPIAEWLPTITVALIVVGLVATVAQRVLSDRIEAARIDDHAKAVR
ncbi:MAG: N-acetylmuramoyl-L-alanine amidase [Pseudomonadota bacterium]